MVSVLLIGLALICVVGLLIAAVAIWFANSDTPPQKK